MVLTTNAKGCATLGYSVINICNMQYLVGRTSRLPLTTPLFGAGIGQGYLEDIIDGGGLGAGAGARRRRDAKVAANWVCNNLFGLLKDQLSQAGGDGELER